MPLLYIDDAVRSLLELSAAPAAALSRRAYGIGGFSPTAGELAAAVRVRVPEARLTFEVDAETAAIVRSWPRVLSGTAARDDWGWTPRYLLAQAVDDFLAKVRRRHGAAVPTRAPQRPEKDP
jgi:nucleoside-diphosphate-sugar epimerase